MRKFWITWVNTILKYLMPGSFQATQKDVLAVIVFSSVGHGPKFHPRDLVLFEKQAGPTSMVFLGDAAL
jgi:hypothetical protein